MLHQAFRLTIIAALAYAAICVAMVVLQRSMIYLPAKGAHAPDAFGLAGVEVEKLTTPDGETVETWRWKGTSDKPVIVFFHGNAGNLEHRHAIFRMFMDLGYGFVALDYRGYGNSTGSPSYGSIIGDARLVLDRTLAAADFSGRKVVLYGESLGTGVATEIAVGRDIAGVILQSPYTSIAAAAAERFPWLPVRFLLTERLSNITHVAAINAPLMILHGDRDELFPLQMAKEIFDKATGPRKLEILQRTGHNDIHPEDIEDFVSTFINNL